MKEPELTLKEFTDRLQILIPRLMQGMIKHEENALSRGLITLPQFWALAYLHDHPDCSMHALADDLNLGLSSATGLADRLAALGLAQRIRHKTDRRVVCMRLTAKGKRTLSQIYAQKAAGIAKLFGSISARERAAHLAAITRLVRQLSPGTLT